MPLSAVEAAFANAKSFLAPVLNRASIERARSKSIIELLSTNAQVHHGAESKGHVLEKAISLIQSIHDALKADAQAEKIFEYDPQSRRIVYALLDLISLEGIYPSLSSGVGIPIERRVKSVLLAGVVAKPTTSESADRHDQDLSLLKNIIDASSNFTAEQGKGIEPIIRDRILVDIICGSAELAFGPFSDSSNKAKYAATFEKLLDDSPTSTLLPILTSLLTPTTPTWLRPHFSTPLSLVPLRSHGVRQTIEFIASTARGPPPFQNDNVNPPSATTSTVSQGPSLPIEALTQASKLLASVPSALTPDQYFSRIAPQLLDLLDSEAGPGMSKAASFIIGGGILNRRAYGAPGTIGWRLFAQPILAKIDPGLDIQASIPNQPGPGIHEFDTVLVSESDLNLALTRLATLITSHPNPALAKRLLSRLMLPLWSLRCFSRKMGNSTWCERASSLLETYFKVSADAEQLGKFARQLLWDGRPSWEYASTKGGGVEIRRTSDKTTAPKNMVEYVESIDDRVDEFLRLTQSGAVDDERLGAFFLGITRRWLLGMEETSPSQHVLEPASQNSTQDPAQMLVDAKIVQKMLEQQKEKLANNPTQIFELVKQLLSTFVENQNARFQRRSNLQNPSLSSLGNIAREATEEDPGGAGEAGSEDEPTDMASIALSLLSTILSSPDLSLTEEDTRVLSSIEPSLSYLSSSNNSIPSSLSMAAMNLSSLLTLQASIPSTTSSSLKASDIEDRKTHQLALTYLTDALPPVRAQGLSLLTALISSRSPVLDVPATTILLLSLLQDDDEFIYLNAVKALGELSQKHSRTIVKNLVSRYVDREEELGLDQRLRLGEALLKTAESLGEALVGDTATTLAEGMIAVSGRRGTRPKAAAEHARRINLQELRNKEAADAWGGELPDLPAMNSSSDLQDGALDREENEALSAILAGWEGNRATEDVRIRTSALSVLGVALETNIAGIGAVLTSTAIDLAISILTLENTGEEKAILRRAAVLLFMSLLKALDRAREEGRKLGFGLAGESLGDVIRVLEYVRATDGDWIVKGHAGAVVESLEAWKEKSLVFGMAEGMERERGGHGMAPPMLGERLAGLRVDPTGQGRGSRPRIEEIE
ncbi:MAG: hypothetical protein M1819_001505 [Sarea resinae]|nr:MAG: hypothetical protein M1819_001505 [Sarea resinae]